MINFTIGFGLGMFLIGMITIFIPQHIRGVHIWLVKENHGQYNSKTRDFELKECK